MMLTVRAEHPDLGGRPVRAVVKVNDAAVIDMKLGANVPVMRKIKIGAAPWAVIEASVDRTWQNTATGREVGLAISWRFLPDDGGDPAS